MIKKLRNAFTIIELVIVIAVIAILAAVMIPTFSNLVKKAETAADIQTVKNFNTIVNAEGAAVGGIKTPHDAIEAVSKNGYNLEYITPTADGRTIVWDATNYQFVLLDEDNKVVYPNDNKVATPSANLFIVSNTYPAIGYDGFAVYLTDGYTGGNELTVATGVDVGNNKQITKVKYEGTGEVLIRTNSESCDFVMTNGIVYHYGVALKAIVETTQENYHCYATLLDLTIYGGDIKPTTLFAGGQGTKESPYLISSADELATGLNSYLGTTSTPTYYKQVSDIIFPTNNYFNLSNDKKFCGEYDGNGYKLIAGENVSGGVCLFDTLGDVTVKNLDLYSNANAGISLFYSTWYATNITVQNVNFYSTNDDIISINKGNFGFLTSNLLYKQHSGENGTILLDNVNVYASVVNEGNCAAAYIGSGAGGDIPTIIFKNCINYGNITSSMYAGVIWGNPSYNANINNDTSLIVKFEENGLKNYGVISGKYAHAFGSSVIDNSYILNELYQEQIGGTYICLSDLAGNYNIYFDGNSFTVNDNGNTSGYTYKLGLLINTVYWDKANNSFSNGQQISISLSAASSGNTLNTKAIHAYDYNTAIKQGIIDKDTSLDYTYSANTRKLALYYANDTIYLIFDPNSGVDYCDSKVSTYLYAYTVSGLLVGTIKVNQ